MTQCDRKKACKFQGLCDECIVNCPDREIKTHELRDNPDLTRIADALEKIARELERGNELKAIEIKMEAIPAYRDEHDGDELAKIIQQDVNEIMEG